MYQKECRICSGDMQNKLDLGDLYPSGFMRPGEAWPGKSPLILAQCVDCNLVQLRHTVPLDSMYRQYWYRSGLNASMQSDLKDVVRGVEKRVDLELGNVVLDIGCNDGTLFDFYKNRYIYKVGFDPALNLKEVASQHCNEFFNNYFSKEEYIKSCQPASAKAITAIAMFYDLPDPNQFLQDIKVVLHPEGILVLQFTDLLSMLKLNAFDNICHEHLEYYSLNTLNWLLNENGFQIFDAEYNTVNGGSLRVYVRHAGLGEPEDIVQYFLKEETTYMYGGDPLKDFEGHIVDIKKRVLSYLNNAYNVGGVTNIHALGASTKGNTLLQYFNLNNEIIPYAAEINHDKFGLVTVGSNIYIVSENASIHKGVELYLVLPWHFEDTFTNFLQRLNSYPKPILLFPLPTPRVYYRQGTGDYRWGLL